MAIYLQYLAGRNTDDAWVVDDYEAVLLMQHVWDHTYGATVKHTITVGGSIFSNVSCPSVSRIFQLYLISFQADQLTREWRAGLASAAIAILSTFFVDNGFDSEACQDFAASALENWSFVYAESFLKNGEVSYS